jgi:hypothetical protein
MIASYLLSNSNFVTAIIITEVYILKDLLVFIDGSGTKTVCNKRNRQTDSKHQYHHIFYNTLKSKRSLFYMVKRYHQLVHYYPYCHAVYNAADDKVSSYQWQSLVQTIINSCTTGSIDGF